MDGSAIPPLTVSYSGFVNNETATNLPTQPTATTTATSSSPAGTYAITPDGGVATNYTFNYVPGTLTINSVPVVFSAIPSKTYGTPDFDPGATSALAITYSSNNAAVR